MIALIIHILNTSSQWVCTEVDKFGMDMLVGMSDTLDYTHLRSRWRSFSAASVADNLVPHSVVDMHVRNNYTGCSVPHNILEHNRYMRYP